jgi:hypothetical protein
MTLDRAILLKNTEELLNIAKDVSNWLKAEKSESLRIDCLHFTGAYSTRVETNDTLKRMSIDSIQRKKAFDPRLVYDVKAYGELQKEIRIYDAVHRDNNVITLDLNKLVNYEKFRVEINYRMSTEFFYGLIMARASPEPLDESTKYHLSAQLKDPENLNAGFSEIDVEDFPVYVDVHMKQNINTNIAPFLKKLSIAESHLLQFEDEHNIREIVKLKQQQTRLKRKGGNKDVATWLNEMRDFLQPRHFLHYIDEDQSGQFRLYNCEWGNLFQALGLVPLPEKMRVINRTDLTIDTPAKSGEIVYKSHKFSQEFKEKFGENRKTS